MSRILFMILAFLTTVAGPGCRESAADRGPEDKSAGDKGGVTVASGGHVAFRGPISAPACARYGAPVARGTIGGEKLREISGLVASRRHHGTFWAHVDHGKSKARLFAIDAAGRHVATVRLKGVDPIDTEDIAMGPCAAMGPQSKVPCIYLGDVGDNPHKRNHVVVYRVREPTALPPPPLPGARAETVKIGKRDVEHLRFRYPKAPGGQARSQARLEHPNAEAMVVLDDTRIVVFSKRKDGISDVFRVAAAAAGVATAERIGSLDLRVPPGNVEGGSPATAADLSAEGRWLAVRTYARLFVFDLGGALALPADGARGALATAARLEVRAGADQQGESVCWDATGGLWHVSEITAGSADVPLWRIPCAP